MNRITPSYYNNAPTSPCYIEIGQFNWSKNDIVFHYRYRKGAFSYSTSLMAVIKVKPQPTSLVERMEARRRAIINKKQGQGEINYI